MVGHKEMVTLLRQQLAMVSMMMGIQLSRALSFYYLQLKFMLSALTS